MATNAKGLHSSPNVYTREFDLTYSPKTLGLTSVGLVGETLVGPAFQPIPISNFTEFKTYFGGTSTEKYANGYPRYELPYIAKSYFSESNQLYVTRVLGLSGYEFKGLWALYSDGSGSTVPTNTVLATLRSNGYYSGNTYIPYVSDINITGNVTGTSTEFKINATYNTQYKTDKGISATGETYSVSLNQNNKNYILNLLGNEHNTSSISKIFVEELFDATISKLKSGLVDDSFYSGITVKMSTKKDSNNNYRSPYSYAKTPWFVSEVKGTNVIPLFRFYTISDGDNANKLFKISVMNVDKSNLTFDVVLRSIDDTDANPLVLETYKSCTLNPNDGNNYIGAKIGTIDELYESKSKYILIELNEDPQVFASVPMGFSGYSVKNISGLIPSKIVYNTTFNDSIKDRKQYFGLSDLSGVDTDFFKFNGIDKSGVTLTHGFHLEPSVSGVTYKESDATVIFDTPSTSYTDKKYLKFTAYFGGGFDGWDIFRENRTIGDEYNYYRFTSVPSNSTEIGTSTDFNNKTVKQFYSFNGSSFESQLNVPNVPTNIGLTTDYYAFWAAARTFANPASIDIDIFATPGIDLINNTSLSNEILDMVENERKDCFYITTTPDKYSGNGDTKSEMITPEDIVQSLEDTGIDTNYAATYYPWCKYLDSDNGQYIFLPPTRDVIRNIALTDNRSYSWFAPAGLDRGNVECVRAKKNLLIDEEDTLYDGRVNFIKTFAKDGIKIWGQKTLQSSDTQLNRIGVRRLLLYLRKTVSRANLPLIFEQNDNTTKSQLLSLISPILNSVKQNRGISDYNIEVDDSIEAKAKHELNVVIWIKPIGALEYINIDFVLTPEGFDFNQA